MSSAVQRAELQSQIWKIANIEGGDKIVLEIEANA
jgi:hypothetical protein